MDQCPGAPYLLVGTNAHLREDATTLKSLKLKNREPVSIQEVASFPRAATTVLTIFNIQGHEVAKRVRALKYLECSTHPLHIGDIGPLFRDEAFRLLVSPSTKENKELSKQRRMLEKVKSDISAARYVVCSAT